ncbi:hypothetical protein [Streptomyces phage Psst4]|uniref:Uncharacterized protein n=10 Tax=Rimavirus TaxID=2560214 RepID=A0A649VWK6_9CAUD|nr:hypothetical protein FDH06_gp42 [Streptomyces phage Rima]YP_009612570.1 hypothetical protein FDI43_gp40 [Streptomyces phage DrGrey]QAY16340.1 hypothetical protein SEA_NAMO_42 [Streptomyces phage Namo]QAY17075.1 hypothetical protein SEA_POPY_41 [Streptomyces phage Popy]QEQ93820.1 hypothetical protein SEA_CHERRYBLOSSOM_41 [Streptomyces phage CherryBlossom]QEQ93988.1 hypothetical protein SEA_MEIBYSRARUS_40 [Streptomyces phage Meibysrarus]QEQ94653.1 hypothetical protein SEA_SOSHI_40 [Streptomy
MNEGLKRLKEEFNENPVAVIGVISVALAAAGKVINAVGAYQGRRAYAKDVNRRVKKSKRYPYAG